MRSKECCVETEKQDSGLSIFKDVAGVLAVAGVALYALAYFIQTSFYSQFNVTPDEVGVDKVSAVLRILPLLFFAALIAVMGAGAFLYFGGLVAGFLPDRVQNRIHPALFLSVLAVVILILLQVLVFDKDSPGMQVEQSGYVSATWAVVIWSLIAVLVWLTIKRYATARAAALATAVALVLAIGITMYDWVNLAAVRLHDSGLVAMRLEWVGIPVNYLNVHWIDSDQRPSSIVETNVNGLRYPARLLILLNESTTAYTLYDCRTELTYIVPLSDVVVEPARQVNMAGLSVQDWMKQVGGCPA
jgi:hypothetical protein